MNLFQFIYDCVFNLNIVPYLELNNWKDFNMTDSKTIFYFSPKQQSYKMISTTFTIKYEMKHNSPRVIHVFTCLCV